MPSGKFGRRAQLARQRYLSSRGTFEADEPRHREEEGIMAGRLSSSTNWLRSRYRATPKTERLDSLAKSPPASPDPSTESSSLLTELVVVVLGLCMLATLSGSLSILLRLLL